MHVCMIDENITPIPPQAKTRNGTDGILFKNVTAMVSSRTRPKPRPASTRRPRFSFHIFNCQKTDTTTPTRGNIPELKTLASSPSNKVANAASMKTGKPIRETQNQKQGQIPAPPATPAALVDERLISPHHKNSQPEKSPGG